MEDQMICQSCGWPLQEEYFGTNADGSTTSEYCIGCLKDGSFISDKTVEELIEQNIEYLNEYNQSAGLKLTKEEAHEYMRKLFPTLKRWQA